MKLRFITGIGIIVFAVLVLVYDGIAFALGLPMGDSTISVVMTDISKNRPFFSFMFVFLMGLLSGHFFIPAKGSGKKKL